MKLAMVSCLKYADCWKPFELLFRKFWPDCPYELEKVTDEANPGQSWNSVVSEFAGRTKGIVGIFQEDFWLNAPVMQSLVEHGIQQLSERNAAMVRLYPCPGGEIEYGDPYFAEIPKGARYRVSCQLSLWQSDVLRKIVSQFQTPQDFEIHGSELSAKFDEPFLAWKRDVTPFPVSYQVTAVVNGKFQRSALDLCAQHGIEVDLSMREVA